MLKVILPSLILLFSINAQAATSYSCDSCSEAQYEALAKQTTGDVYVYDLIKSNLRRYNVVLLTPAKDSPTGSDIKQIIPSSPAQADIDFINKASRVRQNATSINGNDITYNSDFSIATGAFSEYSIYDITRSTSIQRQIAYELKYNSITNPYIRDAIDIINDIGGNIIKVILNKKVVIFFKVELGDGGIAIFVMDTSDPDALPNFDVTGSYDADMNNVITGNNANAPGDYTFSNETNLQEFITHLGRLGIKITGGRGIGSWGCTQTESGVKCFHIN